jgi:beta-galactosidase
MELGLTGEYAVRHYADIIRPEGADVLGTYACDFYGGQPALTCNRYGKGRAYYIASRNDKCFLSDFYAGLCAELDLKRVLDSDLPLGVTAQVRRSDDREFIFLMNFTTDEEYVDLGATTYTDMLNGEDVSGEIALPRYGVRVLAREGAITV